MITDLNMAYIQWLSNNRVTIYMNRHLHGPLATTRKLQLMSLLNSSFDFQEIQCDFGQQCIIVNDTTTNPWHGYPECVKQCEPDIFLLKTDPNQAQQIANFAF